MLFSGHPKGLVVLFFTEMWERFSYYGMRALLIYYLTRHFLFSDTDAYILYGSYTAMVYALPVIGGMLADRYLGARKAIALGAILLTAGHLVMAFEGNPAVQTEQGILRDALGLQSLYLALALIAVGVGLLKPNISVIVGHLYPPDDDRRDSAFTIFYMGINLGAMIATIVCGWLGETYGWSYGFGAAGIGMLMGLIVFLAGQAHLPDSQTEASQQLTVNGLLSVFKDPKVCAGLVSSVALIWVCLQYSRVVQGFLLLTAVTCAVGLVAYSLLRCTQEERNNMLIMLFLIAFSVLFWALFEQAGTSMSLFAERNLDRNLFGWNIRPSQFQSLNPGFIILLAPLFAWLWQALARMKREPAIPAKFGLAVVQVGLGFYMLVIGASLADSNGQVAMIWLILAYLFHTTGELCLSPVGLSMVTRLSVARLVGLVMGVWFLSSAFAANLGALIAASTSLDSSGGPEAEGMAALQIYTGVFSNLATVAVISGGILLLLSPWLARRITLKKSAEEPVVHIR